MQTSTSSPLSLTLIPSQGTVCLGKCPNSTRAGVVLSLASLGFWPRVEPTALRPGSTMSPPWSLLGFLSCGSSDVRIGSTEILS